MQNTTSIPQNTITNLNNVMANKTNANMHSERTRKTRPLQQGGGKPLGRHGKRITVVDHFNTQIRWYIEHHLLLSSTENGPLYRPLYLTYYKCEAQEIQRRFLTTSLPSINVNPREWIKS